MLNSVRITYFKRAIVLSWATIFFIGVFWVLLFQDGVSQHYFQSFHQIDEYILALKEAFDGLRRSVTADNLFIVFYTCASFFFLLGLWRSGNGPIIAFSIGCYLITGFLDLGEGMLYLVMGEATRMGNPPTAGLIFFFAWAAMLKWHFAYLGTFLMSFVVPQTSNSAKALVWGARLLILPVGISVYTVDAELKSTMLFARFVLLFATYLLMIAVARQHVKSLEAEGRV